MAVSSTNFFLDNDDLRFQLSRWDWSRIAALQASVLDAKKTPTPTNAELTETYAALLEELGGFIAKEIAPFEHELDHQHPTLENGDVTPPARLHAILEKLHALGAYGLPIPERLGGSQLPLAIMHILVEMLTRADASVAGEFSFRPGIAASLLFYAIEEGAVEIKDGVVTSTRFDDVVHRIVDDGEWGAMVLTEPGAGSDLAKLTGKATLGADGVWRVTAQKIFITAGHGDHHVVIVRSEDESTHPGLKGLSLFYVPRFVNAEGKRCKESDPGARRNFEIGGVEHKMGQRSAVAATIHYENAIGELIGQRGHGFRGMLMLMNNARIAVGFEAVGACETSYRTAKAYAEERQSMGKPIARHEMIADALDEMDVVIRGLRAVCFEAGFHEEMATWLKIQSRVQPKSEQEQRDVEKLIRKHKRKARHLTPLIKYWGGEESVRMARMCMQIYGGLGYIVETGAEKLLRDALVIPVYEGTSQIQALMALKDNLQAILRNPTRFLSEVATHKLDAFSGDSPLDKGAGRMRAHALSAMQTIITRIVADKLGDVRGRPLSDWKKGFLRDWDPQKDFSFGLLHAERLTKLLTWSAIAETLVRQAKEVEGTKDEEERRELALRFIERFEPRARGVLIEIEATGGSLLGRVLARPRATSASASSAKAAE